MSAPPNGQANGGGRPNGQRSRNRRGRGGGGGGAGPSGAPRAQASASAPVLPPAPAAPSAAPAANGSGTATHLSDTFFRDIPGLSPELLRAIPFERCTEVQAKTLLPILAGADVLAQAKTGTGKTLAFLIPAIQNLIKAPQMPPQSKTSILVLSPTRELAMQIADAATGIVNTLQGPKVGIQVVVGGTNVGSDVSRMKQNRVDILVATPGRLVDLLDNYNLRDRLSNLACLVLDEADRLLDQGFRNELMKIIAALPDAKRVPRQSLLFSATIPQSVHQIASIALKPDHQFISTLTAEDLNTHERVDQHFLTVPLGDLVATSVAVLNEEYRQLQDEFKVMCFLPTARAAGMQYEIFQNLPEPHAYPVWEIHSRMSQSKRMKVTEEFRVAKTGILFSSDVVARGIDIPGVSSVVQIGLPMNGEQYVHRLGRTARAGAQGHGILLLADFEAPFLRTPDMRPLPLQPMPSPPAGAVLQQAHQMVRTALAKCSDDGKAQAYQAFLGYYKGSMRLVGFNVDSLIKTANFYAQHVLLYQGGGDHVETPPLLAKTVGMMGLKGASGLRIVKQLPGQEANQGVRGGGGGRGGGAPRGRPNGIPGSGMNGRAEPDVGHRADGGGRGGRGGRGRGGARGGRPF